MLQEHTERYSLVQHSKPEHLRRLIKYLCLKAQIPFQDGMFWRAGRKAWALEKDTLGWELALTVGSWVSALTCLRRLSFLIWEGGQYLYSLRL